MDKARLLHNPTLIFFCGFPTSGKSATAADLAEVLGLHVLDIDDNIRTPILGKPTPNDGTNPEIDARDKKQMGESWNLLFHVVGEAYLKNNWSLIVTATLSSKKYGQDRLEEILRKYPRARIRLIWCNPKDMTDEEIRR